MLGQGKEVEAEGDGRPQWKQGRREEEEEEEQED